MHEKLLKELKKAADPKKAAFFPRFFKTGKGEYGEGDIFLGITVPQTRSIIKNYREMPLKEVRALLRSPLHECRLAALFILDGQFKRAPVEAKKKIFDLYLKNTKYVNNWDLVDSSAPYIIGPWLDEINDASLLDKLSKSKNLWEQRIAIVATYHFIRKGEFKHTLRISKALIDHKHDLIHKAVGWMLREMGKKDEAALKTFLKKHYKTMPRTMLRYAIEKFSENTRKAYLLGKI